MIKYFFIRSFLFFSAGIFCAYAFDVAANLRASISLGLIAIGLYIAGWMVEKK